MKPGNTRFVVVYFAVTPRRSLSFTSIKLSVALWLLPCQFLI